VRRTLLGLVKHATFVERSGSTKLITRRPRAEIGIPATPDESFILDDTDTIASIREAHRQACESSRRATASLGLDDMVYGNRRGPAPLRWVYLHMLREACPALRPRRHPRVSRSSIYEPYRDRTEADSCPLVMRKAPAYRELFSLAVLFRPV